MATHAVVNFTLDSPGGVEYCTCLINFFFVQVLHKMRYLFVFVLRNGQLKIAKL